jgi:SAM-dependent methyltransferase
VNLSLPICRLCGETLAITFCDLGETPLANSYLKSSDEIANESWYPLHARVCGSCLLVQVDDVVPAEEIFSDYAYFSSYSSSWLEHAAAFSKDMIGRFSLDESSFVVEIASNDGYLLKNFVEVGIPVLGVEPAANVAQVAQQAGVRTDVAFFGKATAERILATHGPANLMAANNVFAHVPDLNDFTAGLATLLADEGVLSIECPHLLRLVEGMQFDTIYHEHYSYFSLHAASNALQRHGLRVFEVQELKTHGGSMRMLICKSGSARQLDSSVQRVMENERFAGLDDPMTYPAFHEKVRNVQEGLVAFLQEERRLGHKVVAYGAAAKGNTLLNSSRIGTDLIEYAVDLNPHKQNHLLPGSHLEIRDPSAIYADRPDTIVILPWNLADEVVEQMAEARSWGAKFVIPIPSVSLR